MALILFLAMQSLPDSLIGAEDFSEALWETFGGSAAWSVSVRRGGKVRTAASGEWGALVLRDQPSGYLQAGPILAGHFRVRSPGGLVTGTPRFGSPAAGGSALGMARVRGYAGTAGNAYTGLALVTRRVSGWITGSGSGLVAHAGPMQLTTTSAGLAEIGVSAGPVAAAVSPDGVIAVATLQERRGRPMARVAVRWLGHLPDSASPLRAFSGPEAGISMLIRVPHVQMSADAARSRAAVVAESRVEARRGSLRGRLVVRSRSRARPAGRLTTSTPVREARLLLAMPHLAIVLQDRQGARSWYLALTAAWRGIRIGITDFSAQSGSPQLAVYEPGVAHQFPVARLAGGGRRVWALLERDRGGHRLALKVAHQLKRPAGPLDRPVGRFEIAFSLERRLRVAGPPAR
ncbi:MAG: hypothetical protein JJ896_08660 [Rhodothermales bacterium]|nr:hypothetical protein [Rhodothermales bacterium]MBO6779709.1 hypothetical protein [Rhodothermales bacterium]